MPPPVAAEPGELQAFGIQAAGWGAFQLLLRRFVHVNLVIVRR
jgi:hypothetical protein